MLKINIQNMLSVSQSINNSPSNFSGLLVIFSVGCGDQLDRGYRRPLSPRRRIMGGLSVTADLLLILQSSEAKLFIPQPTQPNNPNICVD